LTDSEDKRQRINFVNRLIASCLALGLLAVSCRLFTPSASPTPANQLDPFQIPWNDRSIFQSGLVESARPALDELPAASIYHIDFKISDDLYKFTGTEEVRYTNNESVPLNEVQFRLFANILGGTMIITNLQVGGQPVTPQLKLQNSLLIVALADELAPGQSIVLKLDYDVTVPREVERNYGVFAYYKQVLALAHAYPMICVYDDEGWNAEIPSQNGDLTYTDASFYIVRIRAPKDLTLVTSGQRISSEDAGQVQSVVVASGPARDFFMAASRNYQEVSQTFGDVTIHSYYDTNSMEGAEFALEVAADALDVFDKRYAPYPYTELDLVSTPNLALGIEYPGAIALTTRIYGAGNAARGSSESAILEGTVAHEVGHQFFYNLVGNDQLDDPWLDEAMAQFVTLQYYTDLYGSSAAQGIDSSFTQRWSKVGFEKIPIGLPVAAYQDGEYGPIVYGRGPLFIEALKEKMGSSSFDAFLREYTETFSWGIATPEAFQQLAEKHCTCDLDELFKEWVYP
jgi:hypothetical protein